MIGKTFVTNSRLKCRNKQLMFSDYTQNRLSLRNAQQYQR